jgi:hypothetical protein
MLVFDKQRKRCVAPPTADCDPPPTPPPSEDDENNDDDNQDRPFRNRNRNQDRNQGNGIGLTGTGPENRRRFQQGGGGSAPRREGRPNSSQGRPLPPQDFNLPEGALPLNRPNNN